MNNNTDSALSPSNNFNGQNLQQFYPQEGSSSESKPIILGECVMSLG